MPSLRVNLVLAFVLLAGVLSAQEQAALPYSPDLPGYHVATVELARFCLQNNLISQGGLLRDEALKESTAGSVEHSAAQKLAEEFDLTKPDVYTAKDWGEYLDKREDLQKRRAAAAWLALDKQGVQYALAHDPDHAPSRTLMGEEWLEGVGWLTPAEAKRLKPCIVKTKEAPKNNDRVATWAAPYVLVGESFTLVTDLPWWRALRYSKLLDRFEGVFHELVGDVIPRRGSVNLVWLCAKADDFIKLSTDAEFPMTEHHEGAYLRWHGYSIINATRADEVGRLNKAKDNLARTLYHECVHRLVESGICGRMPQRSAWASYAETNGWIVEAIAIVFENLEIKEKGFALASLEAQRKWSIEKMRKAGVSPSLAVIFDQTTAEFGGNAPIPVADKYGVAGSVGWFCLFARKDTYRAPFLGLLMDQYRGASKARDFSARFGMKLDEFEKSWKAYALAK